MDLRRETGRDPSPWCQLPLVTVERKKRKCQRGTLYVSAVGWKTL